MSWQRGWGWGPLRDLVTSIPPSASPTCSPGYCRCMTKECSDLELVVCCQQMLSAFKKCRLLSIYGICCQFMASVVNLSHLLSTNVIRCQYHLLSANICRHIMLSAVKKCHLLCQQLSSAVNKCLLSHNVICCPKCHLLSRNITYCQQMS